MTVQELIKQLQQVEDKTLDVGILTDEANLWVVDIKVNNTGSPGYTEFGSVELVVTE